MAVIVFTVIFLFIPLAKQEKTDHSLAAVLNTVKRLTNFYKQEYKHVNIDGLFGLRVIEGYLIFRKKLPQLFRGGSICLLF